MPGSTTGPSAAWAGTPRGAVISSREQAAVAQAARLPREVRRTIAFPSETARARNAPLEREDGALSALIEKMGASRAQDLIFRSGGQCLAQGCEGIIGPEQILYSAAPPRRQWILDVRVADLQMEMAEQRFSVPSAPTKTAAT
jgi:hypothetical protein